MYSQTSASNDLQVIDRAHYISYRLVFFFHLEAIKISLGHEFCLVFELCCCFDKLKLSPA